jgi:hypothetical protein
MLTECELGTVLAALRFWQCHGPPRPDSVFDRLEADEQDALDEIRTGASRVDPLTTDEIDSLCERLNTSDVVAIEPCACEMPGVFCSGVPGILARMENARLAPGAKVERCDLCQRYASDEEAHRKLRELRMA